MSYDLENLSPIWIIAVQVRFSRPNRERERERGSERIRSRLARFVLISFDAVLINAGVIVAYMI